MLTLNRCVHRLALMAAVVGCVAITFHPNWRALVAESYTAPIGNAREAAKQQQEDIEERLKKKRQDKDGNGDSPSGGGSSADYDFGRWGLFFSANYTDVDRDSRREPGYESDITGATFGGDVRVRRNLIVGGALTLTRNDTNYVNDLGTLDTDTFAGAVFASYNPTDESFIDVFGSVTGLDYTNKRNVGADRVRASYDGTSYSAGLNAGRDWYSGPYSYGPRVKFTYTKTDIDSATETAADLNNANIVDSFDVKSALGELGVAGSYVSSFDWGVLSTQASLFYQHEFSSDAQYIGTTNRGTLARSSFLTDGPDRDTFLGAVSIVIARPQGMQIFGSVEKLFGHSYMDRWTATGGVRFEF